MCGCHSAYDVEAPAMVAAVARHVQHGEARGDLAEGDEVGGHSFRWGCSRRRAGTAAWCRTWSHANDRLD